MKQVAGILLLSLCLFEVSAGPAPEPDQPSDPFDYNFCGGERVYPIVGVNIATACGPRNQIALGRRGKLMWFFPGNKDARTYKGQMQLSKAQLTQLSILAEVAKVTDSMKPRPSKLIYQMGINFSGRRPKYIYTSYEDIYTPSNELLKTMLSMVPASEIPHFPDCNQELTVFNPTLNQEARNKQRAETGQPAR